MKEMKTSEVLYKELEELKKKLLNIKLITPPEAIGKTVKNFHVDTIDFWDPETGYLTVFTDNTALLIVDKWTRQDLSFIYRHLWNDHKNKADVWVGEEAKFFLKFEDEKENPLYVNTDILKEMLDKAEEYITARHQESIKAEIQKRLDEISKLKDQL